jgi:LPS sulfotransferase NodH
MAVALPARQRVTSYPCADEGLLMEENANVCCFMLLSAARTGSNLLLSLLSGHPSIKTYGELFNFGMLPAQSLRHALDEPIEYLRERVYKPYSPEITAVGFKMFYEHLTADYFRKLIDPSDASESMQEKFRSLWAFIEANYDWSTLERQFRTVWDFLVSDRSLAVIHLKRHNLLDSLVSLKTAYVTRQWWMLKDGGRATARVHLEPEECRRYFEKMEACAAQCDHAFEAHRTLDVSYEELVHDREEVLRRVFRFLNVPYQPVQTRMKKQRLAPLSESVANYNQLKQSFEGTSWYTFFE